MRLASRAALWLLLTVGLCSCTRTVEVKAEAHETASLVEQQLSKEKAVETVQVGPETITTTVEEFGCPPGQGWRVVDGACVLSSPGSGLSHPFAPTFRPRRVATDHPDEAPASASTGPLSQNPILVKRTITVDQRGPSTDTKATEATSSSSATQAIKVDSKTETTTKTRYGPTLWLLALLAAALALVGWLAFKFSLFGRIAAFLKG